MAADEFLLEGALSIQAALEAGWRDLHALLLDESKRSERRLRPLRRQAGAASIPVSFLPRAAIDEIASDATHGGVLAKAGPRRYCALAELLPSGGEAPFIAMLDGIEDPYNFAGALRVLYAAGVDGVVLRQRNWTSASAIVGRASAGASERMPLAIADSAAAAADFFRAAGLSIAVSAKAQGARPLFQAELKAPLFLLIGGERRGVTRSFLKRADLLLQIPYGRGFGQSLGTVGAAAVIAFEVMRQRQTAPAAIGQSPASAPARIAQLCYYAIDAG